MVGEALKATSARYVSDCVTQSSTLILAVAAATIREPLAVLKAERSFKRDLAETSPPRRRQLALRTQHLANRRSGNFECFGNLIRLFATGLGKIGSSPAATAKNLRHRTNPLSGAHVATA